MSHRLCYDPDTDCILLTVEGTFNLDRLAEIAPEVARLCQVHDCHRILNDMSTARLELSLVDLFDSPRLMDESGISRSTRRALVVPRSFTDAEFLQTVTLNRGHTLQVFQNRELAKAWLLGSG